MWKILKQVTLKNKNCTPTSINALGYTYNEPKIISNIMNNFFIQKIKNIRKEFLNNKIDPLLFLKNLKPKVKNKFTLPYTNVNEVKQYINELKNSNATGHDLFNSKMLKKMQKYTSPTYYSFD